MEISKGIVKHPRTALAIGGVLVVTTATLLWMHERYETYLAQTVPLLECITKVDSDIAVNLPDESVELDLAKMDAARSDFTAFVASSGYRPRSYNLLMLAESRCAAAYTAIHLKGVDDPWSVDEKTKFENQLQEAREALNHHD